MPIYQYFCKNCQKELEKEVSSDRISKTTVKCPDCGRKTERVFTFSVQTKGGKKVEVPPCAVDCSSGTCPLVKQ